MSEWNCPIEALSSSGVKELRRLQAENAKLREERDMYRDLVGMMDHPDLNVQLQAENAKLRELVCELLTDPDAWDYDYFKRRMRELGVEV